MNASFCIWIFGCLNKRILHELSSPLVKLHSPNIALFLLYYLVKVQVHALAMT